MTGRCLFHVVNMALNVVASKNLAWQERKAEPFVMTPLACGNPYVGFRADTLFRRPPGRHHARHRDGDLRRGGQPRTRVIIPRRSSASC